MFDAVTALNGVSNGDGIAKISEAGLQGMIALRGDLASTAVKKAVKAVTGSYVPAQRACNVEGDTGVVWMSPDELLLLVPYADVADKLSQIQSALGSSHALAVNVSDARAMFNVEGQLARDVLAKLCPVDTSQTEFPTGMIRRTRMAQVPAALWRAGDNTFAIICFRSQARYVFDLLSVAAQPGSEVGII